MLAYEGEGVLPFYSYVTSTTTTSASGYRINITTSFVKEGFNYFIYLKSSSVTPPSQKQIAKTDQMRMAHSMRATHAPFPAEDRTEPTPYQLPPPEPEVSQVASPAESPSCLASANDNYQCITHDGGDDEGLHLLTFLV